MGIYLCVALRGIEKEDFLDHLFGFEMKKPLTL